LPSVLAYLFAVAAVILLTMQAASAQPRGKVEDPKLKPRPVTLKTKDGVNLRAAYFPSEKGKEGITVLLVHEWEGQMGPYAKLAASLRQAGCAVLIPDYRGHGGSREYVDSRGATKSFNIARMSKRDVENIIKYDLEEAKQFLKDENNEELLNLNALVVIGVQEGCVMAAHWAVRDWKFPSVGNVKQGQDVKALIMISPEKVVKGVPLDSTLSDKNLVRLPIMLVGGATSPEAEETTRIHKRLDVIKKKMSRGESQGLELKTVKTSLSGQALLKESSSVIPAIVKFITENVTISDDENPWVERQ
tara:strand:+ start:167022 stop:167933 length:912 start_codon:yes stop_codon:yes gene_type:complete